MDCSLGPMGLIHLGESQEVDVGRAGARLRLEEEGQPVKPGTRSDEGLTLRLEFGMGT